MVRSFAFFLSFVALSGFYGCKKKNQPPANSASIMFVNACAGATPGIDAKIDNVNVSGAANLPFTGNSGYKFVKASTPITIGYFITNLGTPITNKTVTPTKDLYYSSFSGGLVTAPTSVFVADDLSAPATSSAKIRFVNLSVDIMNVTATAQNTVIDSQVTAMEVSSFIQVPAGNYELKAGDPSNINTVVTTGATSLAAGRIYTLMLTGTIAGTGVSALKLTLITNK
jgi:hypothetical protein